VHRQRREADQAARRVLVRARERVVAGDLQPLRQRPVGPVDERLRQRQRVHLHALAIHFGEARVQIDEAQTHRAGGEMPDPELRAPVRVAPLDPERRAVGGHEVEERLRIPMGVDVDRAVGVGDAHAGEFTMPWQNSRIGSRAAFCRVHPASGGDA
jgi:hypothetical protein